MQQRTITPMPVAQDHNASLKPCEPPCPADPVSALRAIIIDDVNAG